jgi:hypothetical protein
VERVAAGTIADAIPVFGSGRSPDHRFSGTGKHVSAEHESSPRVDDMAESATWIAETLHAYFEERRS